MIVGIGTDLIEIARVVKACEKESFRAKYYTVNELDLVGTDIKKLADNFAVKEAVSKMLGTGFRGIAPIDIEVLRDSLGKPYVELYGATLAVSNFMGIRKIFVTITNTKKYSSAFVVGEGD